MSTPESFGPYRVVRTLARGGMAELYLAKKEGPGGFSKTVVVKRVLPQHSGNDEFRAMFRDEARLASLLEHPNVVHITDFGEVDGSDYLAMEYLQGEDLGSALQRRLLAGQGPLPPVAVAHLAAQACAGLHYAHTAKAEDGKPLHLVHRDISPNNLFLTTAGVVKVLDFGIAKAEGKLAKTQAGMVKGKLLYMAPEQVRGRTVDARTDVWAMGLVLYELLTGERPFFRGGEGDARRLNELRTALAIEGETPPPPSQVAKDVPAALDALVLRCLEKSPERRWPTAEALQHALEDFVAQHGGMTARALSSLVAPVAEAAPPPAAPTDAAATEVVPSPLGGDAQAAIATQVKPSPAPLEGTALLAAPTAPMPAPPVDTVITAGVRDEQTRLKPAPLPAAPPAPSRLAPAAVAVLVVVALGAAAWVSREAWREARVAEEGAAAPVTAVTEPTAVRGLDAGHLVQEDAGVTLAASSAGLDAGAAAAIPQPVPDAGVGRVDPAAPRVVARARPGTLSLTCVPYGEVKVDGQPKGLASPELSLELSAGAHQVTCTHPAFGVSAGRVTVKAGERVERRLEY